MNKALLYGALIVLSPMPAFADEGSGVDILNKLDEGRKFLDKGDYDKAEKSFKSALLDVEGKANGRVKLKDRVERMIESARKHQVEHDRRINALRRQQAMRLAYNDVERRKKLHKAKISYLMEKVEKQLEDKQYSQAARLSKEILSLSPADDRMEAKLKHYKMFAANEADKAERKRVKDAKRHAARRLETSMSEDYILNPDLMTFPENFREKTRHRQEVQKPADPKWKTDLKNSMNREVTFDLENIAFEEVVKHLQSVYDIPIIVDKNVLEEVFADGTAPVDLRSTGMTIETALKWICEPLGVRVGYKNGAVYITESSNLDEDKHTLVFDVRDLAHTPPDFIGPEISLAGGEEGGGTITIEQQTSEFEGSTDPEELVELIEKIIESYESRFE